MYEFIVSQQTKQLEDIMSGIFRVAGQGAKLIAPYIAQLVTTAVGVMVAHKFMNRTKAPIVDPDSEVD